MRPPQVLGCPAVPVMMPLWVSRPCTKRLYSAPKFPTVTRLFPKIPGWTLGWLMHQQQSWVVSCWDAKL